MKPWVKVIVGHRKNSDIIFLLLGNVKNIFIIVAKISYAKIKEPQYVT